MLALLSLLLGGGGGGGPLVYLSVVPALRYILNTYRFDELFEGLGGGGGGATLPLPPVGRGGGGGRLQCVSVILFANHLPTTLCSVFSTADLVLAFVVVLAEETACLVVGAVSTVLAAIVFVAVDLEAVRVAVWQKLVEQVEQEPAEQLAEQLALVWVWVQVVVASLPAHRLVGLAEGIGLALRLVVLVSQALVAALELS